jgi:hypothetical protein
MGSAKAFVQRQGKYELEKLGEKVLQTADREEARRSIFHSYALARESTIHLFQRSPAHTYSRSVFFRPAAVSCSASSSPFRYPAVRPRLLALSRGRGLVIAKHFDPWCSKPKEVSAERGPITAREQLGPYSNAASTGQLSGAWSCRLV